MPQTVTINELMLKIEQAKQRMSRTNPHRLLFRQCQDALIQLATRVGELSALQEAPNAPAQTDPVGRIVIP